MTASPQHTRHRRTVRRAVVSVLAVVGLPGALPACSPPSTSQDEDAERVEYFDFDGGDLQVDNDYSDVEVDVEHDGSGTVTVREYRMVVGTSADEPEWTLTGGSLDLGRPCASTVGFCQVSYRITVPEGTTVTLADTIDGEG